MPRKKLLDVIIEAAEDKLARDIKTLDVARQPSLWDVQLLMTADSEPQIRAIVDEITERLAKVKDFPAVKAEGVVNSGWVILDIGAILVHILLPTIRAHYSLEDIWKQSGVIFHY